MTLIRALHGTPVLVPMRHVLGTSAQRVSHAPLLLVDLETEAGITGHAYLFAYLPGAMPALRAMLAEVERAVLGQPCAPLALAGLLARRFRLLGNQGLARMAAAALDVAAWDVLAKQAGLPLARLLGAAPRPVPAYNSCGLGLMAPEATADEAEALVAEGGFCAVKLRLGRDDAAADLAALRAVRRRLPDTVAIMVDYNQALSVPEAIHRARTLDDEGIAWIEEPVAHHDFAGCARVAAAARTPVQIGENFSHVPDMARAIAAGACDLVMPDLERIGGVTGWVQAAGLAAAHGLPMSSHLFPEVSAHLLCATPTAHWLEWVDWAVPLLATPPMVVDGCVMPSLAPGNGLDWNPDGVRANRMD